MHEKQKNKKIILIALLLLLVLVSSTFIGTLAKYVTSGTVSDGAVAAKFGFDIPNTVELFSDSYINVAADESGKKIIAPGTSGQYEFEVSGTSEVAYKVSAAITVSYSSEWDEYEPLEFSLDGVDWMDSESFKTELANVLTSEEMSPNAPYSSTQTIHWRWPFSISSENDIKDTSVGAAAAAGESPAVTVSINVVAEQVA